VRQKAGPDLTPGDAKPGGLKPDDPKPGGLKPDEVKLGVARPGARLLALAKRVPGGSTVADIGTDHGILPAYLERAGLAWRVIGTDSSAGSLASAARTRIQSGCSFELRLGYGLEPLEPGEASVLVLAGLGGQTIAEILTAGRLVVAMAHLAVVQPMKDLPQFRRWAERSRLTTVTEDIVIEGRRIYNVLTLAELCRFAPAAWDALETGIEHEVTRLLLDNEPVALLRYLQTRYRLRSGIASSRAAARPEEARADQIVALQIEQQIQSIEGRH
jgi:tRNA (adenine22-N1)-methyltransferase